MNKIYNKKTNEITIHIVSDSTGETINRAVTATIAQFPSVKKQETFWPMIRSEKQVDDVVKYISKKPGLVVLSILDENHRKRLEDGCKKLAVPFTSPLDKLYEIFKKSLSLSRTKIVGSQHKLDENYFKRVEAFEYAMQHDDGQKIYTMKDADVILVGVSRTSKTPTSIYLANRGLKVANIPLVVNTPLPKEILTFTKPIIIGLLKDPRTLLHVRQTRLNVMGEKHLTQYADLDSIKLEIVQARKIYTKYAWPSIDVSRRSVEETSATIIQIINSKYLEKR